jgi:YNFM family putative membrane transporter
VIAFQPQVDRTRFSAIVALYLATLAIYANMYITQPLLPLLSATFQVEPATAGLSVAAVVIAIACASSAYGPLGERFGRKQVMVGSCLLLAIPTFVCAFAPSFAWLLFFRSLQGVFIPGITAVSVAYLGEQFPPDRLGALVGGLISASVAGGLVGRVASGWLAELAGWQAPFILFSGVTLISAGAMAVTLTPSKPNAPASWVHAYRGMFQHVQNPALLGAFIIGATLFFGFIGVFTYLPYHLTAAPYRLSTGATATIYLVYTAGVIISPIAGRLSARITQRTLMAIGIAVAMSGMLLTLNAALELIILGLIVLCLGMFTAQAIAPAYVNTTAPSNKGGANALYLMFYYIGATFGASLPGIAWQWFSWPGVVAICVGALVVALVANWWLCRDPRTTAV